MEKKKLHEEFGSHPVGVEKPFGAFAVNAEGGASETVYMGFEDKGVEDKNDKKNKLDNPDYLENYDNQENPVSEGTGGTPPTMQLTLDFG